MDIKQSPNFIRIKGKQVISTNFWLEQMLCESCGLDRVELTAKAVIVMSTISIITSVIVLCKFI